MAELDPGPGGPGTTEPRTIQVGISGTNSVESYTLAPGLAQYVEAVYAEVDASGGGDVQPILTLSDQSGVVIAKKRQSETIPSGDTGSATWALRLTDKQTRPRPIAQFGLNVLSGLNVTGTAFAFYFGLLPGQNIAGGTITMTLGVIAAINDTVFVGVDVLTGIAAGMSILSARVVNITTGQQENLSGNTIVVAGNGSARLPWSNHNSGPVLLDRTSTTVPKFTVAGTYILTVSVTVS